MDIYISCWAKPLSALLCLLSKQKVRGYTLDIVSFFLLTGMLIAGPQLFKPVILGYKSEHAPSFFFGLNDFFLIYICVMCVLGHICPNNLSNNKRAADPEFVSGV